MSRSLFPEHERALATRDEIVAFCLELRLTEDDGVYLFYHWKGNGWKLRGKPVKNWRQGVMSFKMAKGFPSQWKFPEPEKKCQFCGKPWELNDIGAWVHQCRCFEPMGEESF